MGIQHFLLLKLFLPVTHALEYPCSFHGLNTFSSTNDLCLAAVSLLVYNIAKILPSTLQLGSSKEYNTRLNQPATEIAVSNRTALLIQRVGTRQKVCF